VTVTDLKELFQRTARAMARRPALARASSRTHARLVAGLACDVSQGEGGRVLRTDQSVSGGGAGEGPHPGQLMGASLAADLAMGYRLWAARLDVPIDAVDVDVVCEWDVRGQMDLAPAVAIGWDLILFDVTLASAAAEADVRRVVETADRLSPMLANLAPAVRRIHRLTIVRPTERFVPSDGTPL
jgi:uncharacterized OsmC-like protein